MAKVLLCLGCLVGVSGVGTLAFWTDTATVPTGSFAAGTLDVTVNGLLPGPGGSTTLSGLTMSSMVPGESVAANLTIAPAAGTLALDYSVTATATGALATDATGLKWTVTLGTAGTAQGSQANGNRSNTCSGTSLATNVGLTTGATTLVGGTTAAQRRDVAAGGSETLCVLVTLPSTAANSLQGANGSATLTVNASQMGAP